MTKDIALPDLATAINTQHQAVETSLRSAVEHATKAGDLLLQAKASVKHGEWLPWLSANCSMSERTARNYMRLAKELPKLDDEKRQRVADLPMREALQVVGKVKTEAWPSEPSAVADRQSNHSDEHKQWIENEGFLREDVLAPPLGKIALGRLPDNGGYVVIRESEEHRGYYHYAVFEFDPSPEKGGTIALSKRPILQRFIEHVLKTMFVFEQQLQDAEWVIRDPTPSLDPWNDTSNVYSTPFC